MSDYIKFVAITEWWAAGVVICLEQGADLHIAQLMPLPLTVSCFSKIQIGFTFLVPAHLRSPGKRAVKRVCVLLQTIYFLIIAAKSEKFHFRFSTHSQHFITQTPFCGPRWVQIAPGTRWVQIAPVPRCGQIAPGTRWGTDPCPPNF